MRTRGQNFRQFCKPIKRNPKETEVIILDGDPPSQTNYSLRRTTWRISRDAKDMPVVKRWKMEDLLEQHSQMPTKRRKKTKRIQNTASSVKKTH